MNAKFTLYQKALQNTFEKHVMNTGGLAIKAGSSALAETVNTVYYWIDGALYSKAAAGIRLRRDSWDMTAVTQQCTACLSLAAAALEAWNHGGITVSRLKWVPAAADMAALSGTVTNAKFNVFVFTVNSAGTLATTMGTEAATLAGVGFPATPAASAVIGFVIINPTGTGNFVGGTTALDDGTVTPNAVYINATTPMRF